MNTRSRLKSWFRSLFCRRRLEQNMEEELSFHLDARVADLKREGLSPSEARRRARIEFGAAATHKDEIRTSLGLRWWDDLWCDLRYAARILRRSPGFTAIAVGSLALAIGANTTIFSVANEILYERLGVPHPEQLRLFTLTGDKNVAVHASWGSWDRLPGGRVTFNSFTYPIYQQLKKDNRVLQDIFAFKDLGRANVTVDGSAQAVQLELVSGNFYEQMRVAPSLGRAISPADDSTPGGGAVAVISDGFWQRSFGRSPNVIGKVFNVNTIPVTIIGVNPRGFTGAKSVQSSPEVFMPLSMISLLHPDFIGGPFVSNTRMFWVQLMARTKPEVPVAQAQIALNLVVSATIRATMSLKKDDTMPELTLGDGSRGLNFAAREFAKPIYVLLALVGFVLLLACANIANLMLARASARQREMSVRLALGAGRSRILRQVLTESLMISFMGGMAGLFFYIMGRSTVPRLFVNAWERPDLNLSFHWQVFAFTAVVTILTGIVFGLMPAWSSTKAEVGTALKEAGKTATKHRRSWSGKAIVAFQIALSTMLVVGSALFIRTLINLNSVDPGFRADHLLLFDINPPSKQYPAPKDVALHVRLEEALRTVPGVQSVTVTDNPLIANDGSNSDFIIEGAPKVEHKRGDNSGYADLADVGRDFVSVMGIPVIAGRGFTPQDANSPQQVAVVNQALVRQFFPHDDPIGKRFSLDDRTEKQEWIQIIGVVADTRYSNLKDEPPAVHFDLYNQHKEMGGATYTVRTEMPPEAIAPSLRAAVQKIDRDLPLMDIRTQQQQIDATTQQEHVFASLTAGFGFLALALSCVGIYGIMAYTVSQRTNEIGIRLALGAERQQVRGMVLKEAGWLAILGVLAGLAAALGLAQLVKTMLYGLKPADPASFAAAGCLLLTVAIVAAWIPALRASRVEPMEALRHE
ncbi:MAG TPA: ABC transporter permease [Edaphobacter sp.]|jgi:predicted permease|nr:ABC transporter permease [Edaphobacter sp.]